ncbi:putative pyruvate formate lyase activating enzyme [Halobiforma haloterrestris]|uniref:Putative pyruvate formate lyase activating enzyme n=1 Tax=Natronobacterium haloterrestre TaxID=148448 RepID=A0A1I1JUI1_NATHA|nr:radical SAM protein [Halobiforma haloterrestris]SFC49030.1 putative pyruvate formate lyase activating enzyme [Halobiforma haloterrestris]
MSTGKPATTPNYRDLEDDEFRERIEDLRGRYADCDLCAYDCRVDRTAGEHGTCQVDDTAYVSTYFPHFGEEEPLKGHNGSGTIFLANCNMKCVFCQNFETSHEAEGDPATAEEIAEMALELEARGCHNVNFVSPTHHSPHLVEAVKIARDRGLGVPIVWNCGGYERVEILERLEGVVDIYMPDVKWGDDAAAAKYSKAPGYWSNVTDSLREMHRQVGDLAVDDTGLATEGLLVRHLVMPNHVESAKRVLEFLAEEISRETFVDVMAQYRPYYKAAEEEFYAEIDRPITETEYREVVDHAREVGLENLYLDRSMLKRGGSFGLF